MATAPRQPTMLDQQSREDAARAARDLGGLLERTPRTIEVRPVDGDTPAAPVVVPAEALRLLVDLLTELAQGNAVTIAPLHQEITTQQAANLLNVSRPFLVKLLDEQKIPSRKVGSRRRVLLKDVLDYKQRDADERLAVLASIAEDAEELGL